MRRVTEARSADLLGAVLALALGLAQGLVGPLQLARPLRGPRRLLLRPRQAPGRSPPPGPGAGSRAAGRPARPGPGATRPACRGPGRRAIRKGRQQRSSTRMAWAARQQAVARRAPRACGLARFVGEELVEPRPARRRVEQASSSRAQRLAQVVLAARARPARERRAARPRAARAVRLQQARPSFCSAAARGSVTPRFSPR